MLYVYSFYFYFSLLKNRLKRACEEHQAKRRRMEIYYNVPQGGKVTDEQRHSYRDDDERREIAEMDTALFLRLEKDFNDNDDDDDDCRPPPPLMDRYMADALQHINCPHLPQAGGRQPQRMDHLPSNGDSGIGSDSEEEEEKEEVTREVVRRLQQQVHRLGSRVQRLEAECDVGRTAPLQLGGRPLTQQMDYLAFNGTAQAQENDQMDSIAYVKNIIYNNRNKNF